MPTEVKYILTPKQVTAWDYLVSNEKLSLLYGGAKKEVANHFCSVCGCFTGVES